MSDIVLIQCTNSKRLDRKIAPAGDLYKGQYWEAMKAYAQSRPEPWGILSAKHGLVWPNELIEPYDERGLSVEQSRDIARTLKEMDTQTVRITAGKDYTDPLTPELERVGIDVIEVCRGMKIGDRTAKLNELADTTENATL